MSKKLAPAFVMGFSSVLLQVSGLRQLLTVFSGNELIIGITLAVWLAAVGAGSFIGHRLVSGNTLGYSFIALSALSPLTIGCIPLIRPFFSLGFGEVVPFGTTILSSALVLFPVCIVVGLQFPLAIAYAGGNAGRVYGIEAAGAFFGGLLFTFFIAGHISSSSLALFVGLLNCATGLLQLRKAVLVPLLLLPFALNVLANKTSSFTLPPDTQLIEQSESRYGEISVLKTGVQSNLYASGKFLFSYPDQQTEEMQVHLPLSVHASPSHILIIGGSPAILREALKYPAEEIVYLETDPAIIQSSLAFLAPEDRAVLNHARVRVVIQDARRYVKSIKGQHFDFVMINLPPPSTANLNRFFTTGFFKEVKDILNKNGILSLTLHTSTGYMGRKINTANSAVCNSLRETFAHVAVSSEEHGYVFASEQPVDIRPEILVGRFESRSFNTSFFRSYILKDAFDPLKVSMTAQRLGTVTGLNTDARPVAYLYNLMVWSDIHAGSFLNSLLSADISHLFIVLSAAICIPVLIFWRKKKAVYYSLFTTGYSSMAFSVTVMLAYQSLFGHVYETIGLLTALFMAGIAIGGLSVRHCAYPLRRLLQSDAIFGLFLTATPFVFTHEMFFFGSVLTCGLIAGVQFAIATFFMDIHSSPQHAGSLYAADLAGSVFGALASAVICIPLLGVKTTVFLIVMIKASSLLLLSSVRDENI